MCVTLSVNIVYITAVNVGVNGGLNGCLNGGVKAVLNEVRGVMWYHFSVVVFGCFMAYLRARMRICVRDVDG